MEPEQKKEEVRIHTFRIVWHHKVCDDFIKLPKTVTEKIVTSVEQKLSTVPHIIGQPLKGTTRRLWRIKFSKYRIVYSINNEASEVWILSVQKRGIIYRNHHVKSLLKLAIAIRQGRNM